MLFPRDGYVSHRHPFQGFGQEVPATLNTEVLQTVPTAEAPVVETTAALVKDALISGALSGLVTYAVSRSVNVEKPKAVSVAFIMGGFTTVGQLLGNWLHTKLEALKATE